MRTFILPNVQKQFCNKSFMMQFRLIGKKISSICICHVGMEKIAYPFHSLIGLLKVVMQTI